jgi:acetyl esterase/lipase
LNAIGSSPDIIRAFAGVSGPYNFTPRAQTFIDIFGEENFEEMKVMNHVSGNEPPMLLLHAEDDSTVALFNQATMASMLEGNQIPVKSILYDAGIGHIRMLLNIHPWFANEANVGHDIDNFLKQHNDDATEVPKG